MADIDRAAIRARHVVDERTFPESVCSECVTGWSSSPGWPCDVIRALDALEQAEQKLETEYKFENYWHNAFQQLQKQHEQAEARATALAAALEHVVKEAERWGLNPNRGIGSGAAWGVAAPAVAALAAAGGAGEGE